MKKEELEKYVGELSPELQEKARACKDMKELSVLLAENDVELSEDALQAVAGGCGTAPTCDKCGTKKEWKSLREWEGWVCPKCKK